MQRRWCRQSENRLRERDRGDGVDGEKECFFAKLGIVSFQVGSIEGRVGVHHLDESQQAKNFTFKCHREGNEMI
ncbi:hypothetical protein RHMOL_Rhmol11G0198300 [Rhododendron molle]|uniref:Uncharacterized protein n=1 Tax=Rhododendron molle TaxID=49168 RepID=A0ACC0LTX0_RHOML|nr:hypothetical protein RHMOL_Rhmol11G0198300 [Rhododendron molle]